MRPLAVSQMRTVRSFEAEASRRPRGSQDTEFTQPFLATAEAPLPDGLKQAIVRSDGHDTIVTEIPDVAAGQVWPGAYARALRNRFVETWLGREGELRRRRAAVIADVGAAYAAGDAENASLLIGQTAGLIDTIEPAGEVVRRISADAEAILRDRLPALLG